MIVAPDKLSASILAHVEEHAPPLTQEEICSALEEYQIVIDDKVSKRIEQCVILADSGEPFEKPFVVAKGTPPMEGRDEEFVWDPAYHVQAQDWQGEDSVCHYSFEAIITVQEETVFGMITPVVQERSGIDVQGNEIQPLRQPTCIELDGTVRRSADDPRLLVATRAGRVSLEENRLTLNEVLVVPGNVDFKSCNIDSHVGVEVNGTILDLFEVKSQKAITVGGTIEAARVTAEEEVLVREGIIGRMKGRVYAGTQIVARFAHEADLFARGDITILSELIHSRVQTEGTYLSEQGKVIGGHLYAKEGVQIFELGSDAYIPTSVIVGFHPAVLQQAAKMDAQIKSLQTRLDRMLLTIQGLSTDDRRLSPEQLDFYADLHVRSAQADFKISEARRRRDELMQEALSEKTPSVKVSQMIYPGVTIAMGTQSVLIKKEIAGPVSIELRDEEEGLHFVAVNQVSGGTEILPSVELPIEQLLEGLQADPQPDKVHQH